MNEGAPTPVVTGFLTRGSKILVLRRSSLVGSYQGLWAGVSGYLEREDPKEQAWVEIGEELGLTKAEVKLERSGEPLPVKDESSGKVWLVHPFRFSLAPDKEPTLDWEHVEMRWITPEQMREMKTVPGLFEAWCRVSA